VFGGFLHQTGALDWNDTRPWRGHQTQSGHSNSPAAPAAVAVGWRSHDLSFWRQGTYSQFMLVQWGNRMKKDHTHTHIIYIHIHTMCMYSHIYTLYVYIYICIYIDKIWPYDKPSTSHSEAALTGMISPHWRLYVPVVLMNFPSVLAEHLIYHHFFKLKPQLFVEFLLQSQFLSRKVAPVVLPWV